MTDMTYFLIGMGISLGIVWFFAVIVWMIDNISYSAVAFRFLTYLVFMLFVATIIVTHERLCQPTHWMPLSTPPEDDQ